MSFGAFGVSFPYRGMLSGAFGYSFHREVCHLVLLGIVSVQGYVVWCFWVDFPREVCCLVPLGIVSIQRYVVWCFGVLFPYRGMLSGAFGYCFRTEVCCLVLLGIISIRAIISPSNVSCKTVVELEHKEWNRKYG